MCDYKKYDGLQVPVKYKLYDDFSEISIIQKAYCNLHLCGDIDCGDCLFDSDKIGKFKDWYYSQDNPAVILDLKIH